jgi:hypothetical protein
MSLTAPLELPAVPFVYPVAAAGKPIPVLLEAMEGYAEDALGPIPFPLGACEVD